jgi:hypothetical protein
MIAGREDGEGAMSRGIAVPEQQPSNHFSMLMGSALVLHDSSPGLGAMSLQGIWMAEKPNRLFS